MRSVTFEALWRDGPVNAQPGAPPGRKIHWDADESVVICPPTRPTRKTANTPTLQR